MNPFINTKFARVYHTMIAESWKYSITCTQTPPKGSKKIGLLQQVVFKCRFY